MRENKTLDQLQLHDLSVKRFTPAVCWLVVDDGEVSNGAELAKELSEELHEANKDSQRALNKREYKRKIKKKHIHVSGMK